MDEKTDGASKEKKDEKKEDSKKDGKIKTNDEPEKVAD